MLKARNKRVVPNSPVQESDKTHSTHQKKSKPTPATTNSSNSSIALTRITEHDFDANDFDFLSKNENLRYLNNGKSFGHTIIKNNDGNKTAWQFAIPQNSKSLHIQPLTEIEAIHRYGQQRFRAKAPDGKTMFAKRVLDLEFNDGNKQEELQIACFSPSRDDAEPFWGGGNDIALFKDDLDEETKQDLEKELQELPTVIKGGQELLIDHASVKYRDENRTRNPDQNTVMGKSAVKEFEELYDSRRDEWSGEMETVLTRAINAPLRDPFKSNYRPEWCHGEGFSLTPVSQNPQRANNLGAAPKWANTEMMVPERIAKWFALNRPNAIIKIKPTFTMLLNSDVIKKIDFEVTIAENNRSVKFKLCLNTFKKYPLFRKASDLAQATAIAYDLLQNIKPVSEQTVREENNPSLPSPSAPAERNNKSPQETITTLSAPSLAPLRQSKSRHLFPTHLEYEKSIVEIIASTREPNYDTPWIGAEIEGCSGTGLVISNQNKKYILTNAHVVENAVLLRARLTNNRKKKYEAKQKCVSYQCDLALLEVDDPEFNAICEPIELGEMVRLQDKVQTIGFPVGGNEVSVTKGIVSRIEVRSYWMSKLDMLMVQVDSAINSGNSGGPVFSNNKVAGVAFQGEISGESLGYMIPTPIIRHFVTEALSNKPYRGFPILPIEFQTLENPYLREYYGLQPHQTGIRISKIDYLCDAYSKLKSDDIVLEIDSLVISNEGTIDIPGIGNCIDLLHVTHMKYIGDTVNLKILRKNQETQEVQIQNIEVTLDHVPLETEKVPQTEHDKMPTYYFASGICFIPVSRNYLNGKGSELEETFVLEESCLLPNLPKKTEDEQLIAINEILDCEANQGYDDYVNSLVKEINGKLIKNIYDVIHAIENNQGGTHSITTASKKKIVVKNMSAAEHKALLSRYEINKDRSQDLGSVATEEVLPEVVSTHSSSNNDSPPQQPPKPKPDSTNMALEGNGGQLDSEDEPDDRKITKKDLGISGLMPGSAKFLAKIDELENRYKHFPAHEDIVIDSDIDLSDVDFEARSDRESEEESEHQSQRSSQASSHSDQELEEELLNTKKESQSRLRLIKASEKIRLFKNPSLKNLDDQSEKAYLRRRKS